MGLLAENTLLAIDVEDVYGTYKETGQVAIPVESLEPTTDATLAERADMEGDMFELTPCTTRLVRNVNFAGKIYPGDEIGFLLNALLGAASTTGAGADKTHVFYNTEANLLARSLCAEIMEASLTAEQYDGMYPNSLTIKGGAEGFVTFEVSFPAQGRGAGAVMSPIVLTTLCPFRYHNAKVYYNSAEISVDSWEITFNLNIKADNFKAGDQEIKEPILNGRPEVTASFEHDLIDRTFRTDYEAGTVTKQFKVVMTHDTVIPTPATPYSLTLELPVVQIS